MRKRRRKTALKACPHCGVHTKPGSEARCGICNAELLERGSRKILEGRGGVVAASLIAASSAAGCGNNNAQVDSPDPALRAAPTDEVDEDVMVEVYGMPPEEREEEQSEPSEPSEPPEPSEPSEPSEPPSPDTTAVPAYGIAPQMDPSRPDPSTTPAESP